MERLKPELMENSFAPGSRPPSSVIAFIRM